MPEAVALPRDLAGPATESAIARLTPDVRAPARELPALAREPRHPFFPDGVRLSGLTGAAR